MHRCESSVELSNERDVPLSERMCMGPCANVQRVQFGELFMSLGDVSLIRVTRETSRNATFASHHVFTNRLRSGKLPRRSKEPERVKVTVMSVSRDRSVMPLSDGNICIT